MKKILFISFIFSTIAVSQTLIPKLPQITASSFLLIDAETNKIIASSKFINYLSNLVDWPVTIDLELKIPMWNLYTKKKKFTFKKSQIVDNGKLGDYYYVIVGMQNSELLKFKITYSQIINSIKK